jgi:uncharacterized coiled-coil protein SlyX
VTFNQVQAIVSGRKPSITPEPRQDSAFPLRHFIKCGGPLTASWSKGRSQRHAYYHCSHHCRGTTIPKRKLEQRFIDLLERMKPQENYLRMFNAVVMDVWRDKQSQNQDSAKAIERQLKNLEARKARLAESYVYERAVDQDTYGKMLDK